MSLRMFDESIRVKDLGSVNSDTLTREIRNAKGMQGGVNLTVNAARQQTRQLLLKNVERQVRLEQDKLRNRDNFQKSVMDLRLHTGKMQEQHGQILQAKHKLNAEKKKDENVVCAMYDNIASDLDDHRRFWEMWGRLDGPKDESYSAVSKIFGDRAMRLANKRQFRDPVQRQKEIDRMAEAYAEDMISSGTNLIFNDKEFEEKHYTHSATPSHRLKGSVFSFRNQPPSQLDFEKLSLRQLRKEKKGEKGRKQSASLLERPKNCSAFTSFEGSVELLAKSSADDDNLEDPDDSPAVSGSDGEFTAKDRRSSSRVAFAMDH